ncbi:hypothetical protein BDF14DRAFT_1767192 [Spinellus fusiger]|nr:hypothetical protein BDF14DRAFT_1767192 [Spinellus fusiger]
MSTVCTFPQSQTSGRRVSFDLTHNTVYLLPSLKECRAEASRRQQEAWERRSLNQSMLDELIISEIEQEVCGYARSQQQTPTPCTPKSCLKKPHKKTSKKANKKSKRVFSKGQAGFTAGFHSEVQSESTIRNTVSQ